MSSTWTLLYLINLVFRISTYPSLIGSKLSVESLNGQSCLLNQVVPEIKLYSIYDYLNRSEAFILKAYWAKHIFKVFMDWTDHDHSQMFFTSNYKSPNMGGATSLCGHSKFERSIFTRTIRIFW